jgi:UPF0755 protein
MEKAKPRRKASSKSGNLLSKVVITLLIISLIVAYLGYKRLYKPNVHVDAQEGQSYLYIRTGSSFEQVLSSLIQHKYLYDLKSFEWMAKKMNYPSHVKPGRYLLKNNMSNRDLIAMLRAGRQVPVMVVVRNLRLKRNLSSEISKQIEADSSSIFRLLNSDAFLGKMGFNARTIPALFIPNTYEFYWNTTAEEFIGRMQKEFKIYWNESRTKKCAALNLTRVDVAILASIIDEETQKGDEKRTIAGLYINRLRKGMRLQSDPTVRFACGDFTIKRILNKHLERDSPYNTYMYPGLPPGPICIPSIASLEAVLNYEKHDYLYMCAKEDFSGYHNFARTLLQHNVNAQKYRRALNLAGIRR